jgi:hypothetical protein
VKGGGGRVDAWVCRGGMGQQAFVRGQGASMKQRVHWDRWCCYSVVVERGACSTVVASLLNNRSTGLAAAGDMHAAETTVMAAYKQGGTWPSVCDVL